MMPRAWVFGQRMRVFVLLGVVGLGSAWGQERARPSANVVLGRMLEKNRERLLALDHYTTERTYRVRYTGTGGEHAAELKVRAEYTGPDQKRFTVISESGSKFLCEKVLRKLVDGEREATGNASRMQSALSPENYNAEVVGEEEVSSLDQGGAPTRAWVLSVSPKTASKFTYKGKVWVSEEDWAVVRISAEPAKTPSWWVDRTHFDSQYVRRGEIWLPGRNVSSSHVRLGGEATLTIDYGSYPEVSSRAELAHVGAVQVQ